MKRFAALVAGLLIFLPVPAFAGETRAIDLQTAIDTALRQNDTVQGERVDVDVANAEVYAARGVDDAYVEGDVSALVQSTEPVDGPFFQQTDLAALGASLAIWKPLGAGGRVGVRLRQDLERSTVRIENGLGMPFDIETEIYRPRVEATFVQPLLRGRGQTQRHAQLRSKAAERDAQAAESDRARDVLVRDVTAAYWELAYASREVAIHESALALAKDQLAITQARSDAGRGSELEVAAVEQAIAAREASLLAAQQAETERALELRVLMAVEDGDARAFSASEPLEGTVDTPSSDGALERALRHSPDLHVIAEHAEAASVASAAAKQDVMPSLDLVLRGGPMGNSDSAGDAFSQMATFDSFDASAMLTFTIPLGNRAAKGTYAASRLREKRLHHAAKEVQGELTAAVQRALDAVDLAGRRITAAEKAASLAQKNVDLQLARWKTGAGTNFDVLERQDQLAAADAALARARADQRIAIAALRYLTGD